ncbi:hypothetical protein JTE90_007142 [Oedothorax gibbosus]|uniref:Uncharacterized protein n=1 Tax=Oedothorax gibbosus TaxID=931172 RepID=A0AAV6VQB6_9ARAC|nr:hypothetical protein JTE90_007142 [Oedothorax gibbosus]
MLMLLVLLVHLVNTKGSPTGQTFKFPETNDNPEFVQQNYFGSPSENHRANIFKDLKLNSQNNNEPEVDESLKTKDSAADDEISNIFKTRLDYPETLNRAARSLTDGQVNGRAETRSAENSNINIGYRKALKYGGGDQRRNIPKTRRSYSMRNRKAGKNPSAASNTRKYKARPKNIHRRVVDGDHLVKTNQIINEILDMIEINEEPAAHSNYSKNFILEQKPSNLLHTFGNDSTFLTEMSTSSQTSELTSSVIKTRDFGEEKNTKSKYLKQKIRNVSRSIANVSESVNKMSYSTQTPESTTSVIKTKYLDAENNTKSRTTTSDTLQPTTENSIFNNFKSSFFDALMKEVASVQDFDKTPKVQKDVTGFQSAPPMTTNNLLDERDERQASPYKAYIDKFQEIIFGLIKKYEDLINAQQNLTNEKKALAINYMKALLRALVSKHKYELVKEIHKMIAKKS